MVRALVVLCVLGSAATVAVAAPRTPAEDAEVLQVLPVRRGDAAAREMASLRALLAREPAHVEAATRLASLQLGQARRESDARLLGQAEATLAPWWHEAQPPGSVLLLRAMLRQSSHDFRPALEDLASAVQRNPESAQAWLTRATVQQVTGDLEGARASCRRVAALTPTLVAIACLASVDGASGRAAAAYRALDAVLAAPGRQPDAVKAWAMTLKAELAERLAMPAEAEAAYRQALILDPHDAYAVGAYADFLLDHGRASDVLRLVARPGTGPLLLRYVLAARAMGTVDARVQTDNLAALLEAARARGDRVHLREEARFLLHVRGDARAALGAARENWAVQKEPADARLVLEAALSAGDRAAAGEVRAWLAATRLEDPRLAALSARAGP